MFKVLTLLPSNLISSGSRESLKKERQFRGTEWLGGFVLGQTERNPADLSSLLK